MGHSILEVSVSPEVAYYLHHPWVLAAFAKISFAFNLWGDGTYTDTGVLRG